MRATIQVLGDVTFLFLGRNAFNLQMVKRIITDDIYSEAGVIQCEEEGDNYQLSKEEAQAITNLMTEIEDEDDEYRAKEERTSQGDEHARIISFVHRDSHVPHADGTRRPAPKTRDVSAN